MGEKIQMACGKFPGGLPVILAEDSCDCAGTTCYSGQEEQCMALVVRVAETPESERPCLFVPAPAPKASFSGERCCLKMTRSWWLHP